jgi:hypothetical protein
MRDHHHQQQQQPPFPGVLPSEELLAVTAAGVATFGSTLAISTWLQGKWLGVSTGTRAPTPTLAGLASVCVASYVSHHVALRLSQTISRNDLPYTNKKNTANNNRTSYFGTSAKDRHEQRVGLMSNWRDSLGRHYDMDTAPIPWHTLRMYVYVGTRCDLYACRLVLVM